MVLRPWGGVQDVGRRHGLLKGISVWHAANQIDFTQGWPCLTRCRDRRAVLFGIEPLP